MMTKGHIVIPSYVYEILIALLAGYVIGSKQNCEI